MHDRDEIDSLIDRALASYAVASADGLPEEQVLETRVLARVRREMAATHAPSPKRWLPWAFGLATAACVLALIFTGLWQKHAPAYVPANTHTHDTAKVQLPKIASPVHADHSANVDRAPQVHLRDSGNVRPKEDVQQVAALPKLDVFPAPEPASHEVQAFAVLAQRLPAGKVHDLLAAEANAGAPISAAPISIDELEIQPLTPLDEGGR